MPGDGVEKPEDARALAIQRLRLKQDFRGTVAGGALAVAVSVAIWLLGGGGNFWPMWVMLGVAIAIVVTAWKAHGPSGQITEADVEREMQRH